MFTDLVGSTEALVALGEDRFDSVRDEHDALVGGAIAAHHGELVKHTGDGYMAVFRRAGDAVAAAVDIQRLVSRRNEGSVVELGVRIGISAGDVAERAGDYHGVAAVEAARLCSAAMGGQVLASETVRSLVGAASDHDFVALGELDLKGLPPVVSVALRWCEDAPVLAPTRRSRGNLPASLDSFVGRGNDLEAIGALLNEHRLVTLTGPGGSGKTRLALEVARGLGAERADGVWLVELASIDDAELAAEATMGALGLRGSDTPARDELWFYLARRDTLLLFDNCEHVLDGAATLIAESLAVCPMLRVLATSREPLRVPGEAEYSVEGLVREDAIQLFADRVPGQRRNDDPDAIERICASLEGIPLAIELAAAKLRVLSAAQLAARLDDQLAVLARGKRTASDRHRTLRAALDWSYDLLDEDERGVFRRLGIFAGGFNQDAAQQVVADDQISRARVIDLLDPLVERSLVTMALGDSGARFRLLEPVRQYAAERLDEAGERDALARRHLGWVRHLTRQALLQFFFQQGESTSRISEEHPNICQALEFAIANREGVTAAEIIDAVGWPWAMAARPDARVWCERVLAVVPADAPPVIRAGALVSTSMMLQGALRYDVARSLLLEARELYRSANNVLGEAVTLVWLGREAQFRAPESTAARALFEEALSCFRENDMPVGVGSCLASLAQVALHAEDDDLARRHAAEALQLGRSTHVDQIVGEGMRLLAVLDARAGDFESADRRLGETIAIWEAAGARAQLLATHNIAAELSASRRDVAGAASYLAAGAEFAHEMPSSELALDFILSTAYLAYIDGRPEEAAVLYGARLAQGHPPRPTLGRPILEALEKHALDDEIAAGANLNTDEAFERAIQVISQRRSAPA